MRKLLFVMLAIALAAPAFAGDALVLPGGVGRVYVVPVYGLEGGTWVGSDYQKTEDNDFTLEKLFNLGGAIEYGVTDAISLGIQWAPGINLLAPLNSEDNTAVFAATDPGVGVTFETQGYDDEPLALAVEGSAFAAGNGSTFIETPTIEEVTAEGISPVAIGAEIQIVGSQGFVPVDGNLVRVSVTPGMEVALPGPDWESQGKAYTKGNDYVDPRVYAQGLSPRWAVGGQFDFDVVPTDAFYLNLGFEYKYRFPRVFDATGFYEEAGIFLTEGSPVTSENLSGNDVKSVEYRADRFHEISVDLEPDYQLPLNAPLRVNIAMPTTLAIATPSSVDIDYKIDTTNHGTIDVKEKGINEGADSYGVSYLLTTGPSVSVFFTELPLPVQLVGYWNFPLTGSNASQRQTGVLEARVYFSTN